MPKIRMPKINPSSAFILNSPLYYYKVDFGRLRDEKIKEPTISRKLSRLRCRFESGINHSCFELLSQFLLPGSM